MPVLDLKLEPVIPKKASFKKNEDSDKGVRHQCFGETKTLKEWIKDPRCIVKKIFTINLRIRKGWSVEDAMTKPTAAQIREKPEPDPASKRIKYAKVTAWGEEKTVSEWCRMDFCDIPYVTLWKRLFILKWSPEDAIITPKYSVPLGPRMDYKDKTLGEIVRDTAAIKRGINKFRLNEKQKQEMIRKGNLKGLMKIVKVDEEDEEVAISFSSRLGIGTIFWDSKVFPEVREGEEFSITVVRTRTVSQKVNDSDKMREKMIADREKFFTRKKENLSAFDE